MKYPFVRMHRLRRNPAVRGMVAQTRLDVKSLIAPLFVTEGSKLRTPIAGMPGQYRFSPDQAAVECRRLGDLGIQAVLLFGIPSSKDATGSAALQSDGVIPQAIAAIKAAVPALVVITDVCLCEYTSHGHCGLLDQAGTIDNDATLPLLAAMALTHCAAGADIIAPSDMMDGRVAALRSAMDEGGYTQTPIMSYAVKYASVFYGPFRDAAGSAPHTGDRCGYQMDPPNLREALSEAALDEQEGADILMVKPAMAYLDVIAAVRSRTLLPLAAYQVSGEYVMLQAGAQCGAFDLDRAVMECLTAIARAGADLIITYFADRAAHLLQAGSR